MALLAEWNIQNPAAACAATGRPFAEGDKIVTVLLQDRKGDWKRLDYAASEWPRPTQGELVSPLDEEGMELLSSWRSRYKPRVVVPSMMGMTETLTKDNAEGLLRRLLSERNPAHLNACYILALMLERKRMLKELDRRDIDGQPCLIYEHVPSGETWIIPNPPMRLDEMTRVQTEVMELLAGPSPTAEPPVAESSEAAQPSSETLAEATSETSAETAEAVETEVEVEAISEAEATTEDEPVSPEDLAAPERAEDAEESQEPEETA